MEGTEANEGGEDTQQRIYVINEKLQEMARGLPLKYQQRVPFELLSSLANALVHPHILEIVKGLKEIQNVTEKKLFGDRLQLQAKHRLEKEDMIKKHRKAMLQHQYETATLKNLKAKHEEQLKKLEGKQKEQLTKCDMRVILQTDQKISDQQGTLEKAGVPGFYVTNNPIDIRLQMYLLEFIRNIAIMNIS